MATAPVKTQPLHNFPVSLKWGQNTAPAAVTSNQHNRTMSTLAPDVETESDEGKTTIPHHSPPTTRVGSRSARIQRFSFTSCSSILPKPKNPSSENPQKQMEFLETVVTEKSQQKQGAVLENNNEAEAGGEEEKEEKQKLEEEEGNSRPWKLRPRKGILAAKNGGELKETLAVHVNEHGERDNMPQLQPKSVRLKGLVESTGGSNGGGFSEKKEKRKLWIALSKEEIEEDIFALTGSRPARRPRKRPKNVQRAVDNLSPGSWLVGTTADSCRIVDIPAKR